MYVSRIQRKRGLGQWAEIAGAVASYATSEKKSGGSSSGTGASAGAPISVAVSPQISPQISPVFQQQFQPQNSAMTAGTSQSLPPMPGSGTGPGMLPSPYSPYSPTVSPLYSPLATGPAGFFDSLPAWVPWALGGGALLYVYVLMRRRGKARPAVV
jgi:hypothetical protein